MRYPSVRPAVFLSRPNRFAARVLLDGEPQLVHVCNTGRLGELLLPGAPVYLAPGAGANRRTQWDLVAVRKGPVTVNIDSYAPNRAAAEFLPALFPDAESIRPEQKLLDSRFDFLITEKGGQQHPLEVKGVTLERDGTALFPDAPTLRGTRHVEGLRRAVQLGMRATLLFIVQMEGVRCFVPNRKTDPAFADALCRARAGGVRILCRTCRVTPDSMEIGEDIPVRLDPALL